MKFSTLRKRAGLTKRQLAERAGVTYEQVKNIERGLVKSSRYITVASLADALDVTAAEVAACIGQEHIAKNPPAAQS